LNRVGVGGEYDEFRHTSIQGLRALVRTLLESKVSLIWCLREVILKYILPVVVGLLDQVQNLDGQRFVCLGITELIVVRHCVRRFRGRRMVSRYPNSSDKISQGFTSVSFRLAKLLGFPTKKKGGVGTTS
jgi:hypothetical protein